MTEYEEEENQNVRSQGFMSNNQGYNMTGVVQIRLDTKPVLDDIEVFLRGRRILGYRENKDGFNEPVWDKNGEPRMNDKGIQSLLTWLTTYINPQTVQGNFSPEQYENFICEFDIALSEYMMCCMHDWEIDIKEFNGIADGIAGLAQAFFSRLIDNKERESYSQSIRSTESNVLEKKRGGLLGMFKG